MEIDMVLEKDGEITILEGKNGFPRDFAVYQLFHPHLYYRELESKHKLHSKVFIAVTSCGKTGFSACIYIDSSERRKAR